MPRPELSLVIPIFNEEEDLPQVDARLKELLQRLGVDAEVLFVDDGSRDRTMDVLLGLAGRDARYKVLSLSRRFGRERAIAAGIDKSRGRAVIVTDAELQPAEVFLETIDKWKAGFDVVFGRRKSRAGSSFGAGLVASLFGALMPIEVPLDAGDFRLISRRAVAALRGLRETHRSPRALIAWAGFRQTTVEFERLAAEKQQLGFSELLSLALDGVASFSIRPLRIATWLGALLGVCAVVFAVVALAVGLGVGGAVTPLLFSVQFILLGILGEYVGRIYEQVKRRPLYVVAQRIGFGSKKRAEKLVTRDIEELASFPRTPSVPPALPKPPSVTTAVVVKSEVPPPPPAVVAAGAAAEAAISNGRISAAPTVPGANANGETSQPRQRVSVTPAPPPATGTAKPPPLRLSSSLSAIPAAPPAPVVPERASTPPMPPRRPSFASIPHPAVAPPPLGQARVSRPPSLPRTPSAPPVSSRTPSVPPVSTRSAPPPVSVSRTPSAPPVSTRSAPPRPMSAPPAPRPLSSPPSASRTPSAPPVRASASRIPAAPRPIEITPPTTRSPSTAPPANEDKKG